MTYELLVDSKEFWDRLKEDILNAKNRVAIQAMTFECDSAGAAVYQAMCESEAQEKRIIIDKFTSWIISDHFVFDPGFFLKKKFRDEHKATRDMFKNSKDYNVEIRRTNPFGFLLWKYPARNHKKLMLIDDHIAYVGGINFSDHNFEWHDMMVRIDSREVAPYFWQDFETTWEGRNQAAEISLPECDLYFLDAGNSHKHYEDFFQALRSAKRKIQVTSPYITEPFLDVLDECARAGIEVEIYLPEKNNKPIPKYYIQYKCKRGSFKTKYISDTMSHLKAILIDDETLIAGSSNFDFISYNLLQEICVVFRDKDLIADFKKRVFEVNLARSHDLEETHAPVKEWLGHFFMQALRRWCLFLAKTI